MLFNNPLETPWENSVYITHSDGKPLVFDTTEQCMEYAKENQQFLFQFAYDTFEGKAVPNFLTCVPESENKGSGMST